MSLAALMLAASLSAAAAERPRGDNVWVFIVSVLEWKDSETYVPFPKAGRRDEALIKYFRQNRKVPEDHIVWLKDEEATARRIKAGLPRLLERTKPGDTLFLYYAGHGSREQPGITYFTPYDAEGAENLWPVPDIVGALEKDFHGDWALVAADCCFSGGLCQEVVAHGKKASYGCLASAQSSSPSTGEWTFSDSLLKGLNGSSRVDRDGDKSVRFGELADFVESEMAFSEQQLSASAATGGFTRMTKLADVSHAESAPERVTVHWRDDKDYRAAVLGDCAAEAGKKGKRVHYYGWEETSDECMPVETMRPYAPPAAAYKDGAPVFVEWNRVWYQAKVRGSYLGLTKIQYDGYDEYWDEWVAPARITGEAPCSPAPCGL